ncbi:hypothetical protein G6F62_010790 [Rhizopus arrhizus]|nr:hypothetical protein G6F22_010995 [Rhizopus arrhizus]KAG1321503.1 hypothetical protein G6F62_010790 [Rhizopus arrhizus]
MASTENQHMDTFGDKSSQENYSSPCSGHTTQKLTTQRSVPAFLNKLYNMVDDASTNDLVQWSKDGLSFIVRKHEEFAKIVLPRFYKHNTFASFVRQLNMYDFHKIPHIQQGVMIAENEHEIWEFSNPHFQKGRPDLLILVTRKKNKDRDATDGDLKNTTYFADNLIIVKKHQTAMGDQLKELQRDNEILWQETLNSREKYHRHQEAIEKILLFLTAVFSDDSPALAIGKPDMLPRPLIEEAASLADITINQEEVNRIKSSSAGIGPTTLTNVLSSVLKLYSASNQDQPQEKMPVKTDMVGHTTAPVIKEPKACFAPDLSHALNTAGRSAQSITEEIEMLQMNVESLANNLGIDSNQYDDDLDMEHFQTDYNLWNNQKLYSPVDSLFQNNIELRSSKKDSQQQNTAAILHSPNHPGQKSSFFCQQPPFKKRQDIKSQVRQSMLPTNSTLKMQPQIKLNNTNDSYQSSLLMDNNTFSPNYPNYVNQNTRQAHVSSNANLFLGQSQENYIDLQDNFTSRSSFYKKN